uniref:Uncharacterized protein n=1 Tax=Rhizophagus irregularis (strain DAOM 181602 / DAOM 197198 / MUCL 43194) TaxID=747089 RepID=U9UFJ2_RHIID
MMMMKMGRLMNASVRTILLRGGAVKCKAGVSLNFVCIVIFPLSMCVVCTNQKAIR